MGYREPCAHCGCAKTETEVGQDCSGGLHYAVMCADPDCGAFGPIKDTLQEAEAGWNARAVIRCGECRFAYPVGGPLAVTALACDCLMPSGDRVAITVPPNGFCYLGERKAMP